MNKTLNIGDTVYQCDGVSIYPSTIFDIYEYNSMTVYDTENIAFDERAIGTSIFLTEEEAKRRIIL